MRPITIIIAVFALLGAGCASISGTNEVVSIDSQPRGAEVYLKGEATPIGVTPFFYKMARVPDDAMEFRFPGTKPVELDIRCQYRWLLEGLSNGALVLISPEGAVGAFLLDYITGAAFTCGPAIMVKGEAHPRSGNVEYCKRYLVAPPENPDEALSDRLAEIWIKKATLSLRGCDEIIPYQDGKDAWQYFNVDNDSRISREKIGQDKLNQVGLATGATHLAILDYNVNDDIVTITPEISDLHSFKNEDAAALRVVATGQSGFTPVGSGRRVLLYSISVFPNAVTLGRSFFSVTDVAAPGYELTKDESSHATPLLLGGWGLTSIEHPDGYGDWDFVASLYPTLSPLFFNHDIGVRPDGSSDASTHSMSFFYLVPLYHAGITAHTPLGAFSLDAGGGPAFYRVKLSGYASDYGAALIGSVGFTYTAFISRNLFLQAGSESYSLGSRALSSGPVRVEPYVSEAYILGGYFLPELKQTVRHLM